MNSLLGFLEEHKCSENDNFNIFLEFYGFC